MSQISWTESQLMQRALLWTLASLLHQNLFGKKYVCTGSRWTAKFTTSLRSSARPAMLKNVLVLELWSSKFCNYNLA
jgi:hypothetical protein